MARLMTWCRIWKQRWESTQKAIGMHVLECTCGCVHECAQIQVSNLSVTLHNIFFFSEINQALGSHNYFITHFGKLKGRLIALSGCCWVGKQDLVSKEIGTSEWEPPVHWGNFNFHGKQCAVWVSQSGCVTGKTKQNKNHLTSLCFVFLICEVGMVWVPSISMGE